MPKQRAGGDRMADGGGAGRMPGRSGPIRGRTLRVLAAVGVLAAGGASAHTESTPLAPFGDFTVRWYQPHGVRPVTNWEIEVKPAGNLGSPFITSAQVVPDDSCWGLDVPVSYPAIVRIRSVAGGQVSTWSRSTVVPEPELATGLATAAAVLVGLAGRRRAAAPRDPSARPR